MKSFFIAEKYKFIYQYICVTVGALLMSVAVVSYFDALGIVAGGVTGISIILKKMIGIPMWIVSAGVNLPLFVAGYRILKRKRFWRTFYTTVLLTVFLGAVPRLNILTGDYLVDIVIGSIFMGAGLGMIFRTYTSSGGTDLLAMLLNERYRFLSVPKIMAIIDSVIVAAGAGVFGIRKGIYAIIAIYVVERVADGIVEGPNRAKLLYIITEQEIAISEYIINEISRGVTIIKAKGGYTKEEKNMLMCVVSSREMVKIKQKTYQIDENAICFVGDIREAFGEGFTKFG